MVAAAWADGVITNEEINSLKDLLFHLKGITAQDWAEIDIYVESPVEEAERQRLVEELEARLSSPEEKNQAIQALDQMVQSGGAVGEQELAVVNEIKAEIPECPGRLDEALEYLHAGESPEPLAGCEGCAQP